MKKYAKNLVPPTAPEHPHQVKAGGAVWTDEFFWLRERDNPGVIDYLRQENSFTEAVMKPLEAFQETLFQEMKSRIKETDMSVPVRIGPYYYYSRTKKDCQYPLYARKRGRLDAPEELLLDLNALAEGHDYLSLGILKISPDHRYLAYALDTQGSEEYTIQIKDLKDGVLLPDTIEKSSRCLEWSEDGRYFFYITLDDAKRPWQLHRHRLGSEAREDRLIYTEADALFNMGLSKTRDRRFILLEIASSTTSETRLLQAANPEGEFKTFRKREKNLEYYLDHREDLFFIRTNLDAVNFRIMTAGEKEGSAWQEFLPYQKEIKTEDIHCFHDFLVVEERERGLMRMRLCQFSTGKSHRIEFPETVYSAWSGQNPEYGQTAFRLHYTSLVAPPSVYDYHMVEERLELLKQTEVLGGYDSALYSTERLYAPSHDGIEVPISLVYRKDVPRDGRQPLLLYGYGSYGISMDPEFSSNRLSLLDRGVVFAIAHIRGGGDLGRPWYEDGKFLKKKNTFLDFIACAEFLIEQKWTCAEKLAISGGSAGGLLMGAVTNLRPELFHAVIAKVPFVDVINTMLDKSLPLTVGEYEEWGNPEDPAYFEYIRSYSPYDHVTEQRYPNMLITGGLYDPRVQYWEPAKWTARLRRKNKSKNLILLKMNMEAGHGGASGRYDYLREIALDYAFLLGLWDLADTN